MTFLLRYLNNHCPKRRVALASSSQNHFGVALVELVLVLPLILLAGFTALEFSNLLRYNEIAQLITREGANRVYRECAVLNFPGGDRNNCMDTVASEVQALSTNISPDVQAYVVLATEITGNTLAAATSYRADSGSEPTTAPGYTTQQRTNDLITLYRSGGSRVTLANPGIPIATAEVWIVYRPIIPFVATFFGLSGGLIHDFTLI